KATNARQQLEISNQALNVVPGLLTSVTSMLVVIVGGYRVINGHLSIGMLVALQSLLGSFMSPMSNLIQLGGTFQVLEGDHLRVQSAGKAVDSKFQLDDTAGAAHRVGRRQWLRKNHYRKTDQRRVSALGGGRVF